MRTEPALRVSGGTLHASPPGASIDLGARTVLVVEDEALIREMIVGELDEAGFIVLEAGSAEEAIEILDRYLVGILFTDIRMPGRMDGWALAEEAHRRNPALKVLYTTGYSEERPRRVPNSLYIAKPYRPSEVIAAIARLAGDS
ncbi:response regulator [Enterovirga aerilata]|uniref:Response regulator n=1 Tax=Enterovirga aerilata TaxID=2730920 RepID=A0A849I4U6_9HYPH|nr:response regulator [Enterovirga sp. DB1703]NNM72388.1 response regulator [Enterovirga sp. DB1703]